MKKYSQMKKELAELKLGNEYQELPEKELDRIAELENEIDTFRRIEQLRFVNSNIGRFFEQEINYIIPESDTEVYNKLSEYCKDITHKVNNGNNLFLFSNQVGNGKTTWAKNIIKALLLTEEGCAFYENSPSAYFITASDYIYYHTRLMDAPYELKEELKRELYMLQKKVNNCKLLVLDDLAVKSYSQYEKDILFRLLDSRLNDIHKTTIITSNGNIKQLKDCISDRIADRIDGFCIPFEFKAESLRGINK